MTRPIPDPLPDPSLLANPVWVAMASPEELDAAWALHEVESICLSFRFGGLVDLVKRTMPLSGEERLIRAIPGETLPDLIRRVRRTLRLDDPDA